jgi:hypothetical protein
MVDVRFVNHSSLVGIEAVSDAAKDWIAENVEAEGYMWVGPVLMAEPRYAFEIAWGMRNDGMEVEW